MPPSPWSTRAAGSRVTWAPATTSPSSAARNSRRARAPAEIRLFADNVPVLISYFSPDLRCMFANKAYAETWGRDVESIIGLSVEEIIGAEGFREIEPHIRRVLKGEPVTYERSINSADGNARAIEVNLLPQLGEDGSVLAAFVLISDITRHRLSEQAVRDSEERLRKFAEATHEGIVFHEDGILTDCNDAALRLIGRRYEEVVKAGPCSTSWRRNRAIQSPTTSAWATSASTRARSCTRTAAHIDVEFNGKVMPYKGKHHRMTVIRDIRDRKEAQARIQFLAHHDILTGLPNRALFLDRLEFVLASARRRGSKVAILFVDLDDFKAVNDSLGHAAGDALLRLVAGRIEGSIRSVDVVARFGGDEFLVILPDLERERSPVSVAEKLLAAVKTPAVLEGKELAPSASIGIAVFPDDGDNADELIKNADAAMYLAKDGGRGTFRFFGAAP